jgi:hypothetical protein
VSHGLIVLIVFLVLGFVFARSGVANTPADRLISYIVWSTVISGLALAFYFTVA